MLIYCYQQAAANFLVLRGGLAVMHIKISGTRSNHLLVEDEQGNASTF